MVHDMEVMKWKLDSGYLNAKRDNRINKLDGQLKWFRNHSLDLRKRLDTSKEKQSKVSDENFLL